MFSVRYVIGDEDGPGYWAIFKGDTRWSIVNHRTEEEALSELEDSEPEAAAELRVIYGRL